MVYLKHEMSACQWRPSAQLLLSQPPGRCWENISFSPHGTKETQEIYPTALTALRIGKKTKAREKKKVGYSLTSVSS